MLLQHRVLTSQYDEVKDEHGRVDAKRLQLQGVCCLGPFLRSLQVDACHHPITGQLENLASVRSQRLRQLEVQRPGIMAQCEWVREHTGPSHGFKGPVLGPLALEVDVRDPLHAAMVEHMVPRSTWTMFVVEHPDDQTLLISKMQAGLGDRPAVTCMRAHDAAAPIEYPGGPAAQYAQWGITHTLDEVVHAPGIVKHTLCNEGSIHKAYVGTRYDKQTERWCTACVYCTWG